MAVRGYGDVNERARLLDQAMKLSSGLMAEYGVWPRAQQCGPKGPLARRFSREGGVDAPLESLPSATAHPASNRRGRQARLDALRSAEDAGLSGQEFAALARIV